MKSAFVKKPAAALAAAGLNLKVLDEHFSVLYSKYGTRAAQAAKVLEETVREAAQILVGEGEESTEQETEPLRPSVLSRYSAKRRRCIGVPDVKVGIAQPPSSGSSLLSPVAWKFCSMPGVLERARNPKL